MQLEGVRPDLVVPLGAEFAADPAPLLECWRWRAPEPWTPWFATAIGDLFLRGPGGAVGWLDVGGGDLETVAANEAAFQAALGEPKNVALWFAPAMVDQLRAAGRTLAAGEVYSYERLPLLGGDFAPANFRVRRLHDHCCTLGMQHREFHEHPEGAGLQFGPDD